jgi:hypothetical protein
MGCRMRGNKTLQIRPCNFALCVKTNIFDNCCERWLLEMKYYYTDASVFRELRESRNSLVNEVERRDAAGGFRMTFR